jgi:hypothetical protein
LHIVYESYGIQFEVIADVVMAKSIVNQSNTVVCETACDYRQVRQNTKSHGCCNAIVCSRSFGLARESIAQANALLGLLRLMVLQQEVDACISSPGVAGLLTQQLNGGLG